MADARDRSEQRVRLAVARLRSAKTDVQQAMKRALVVGRRYGYRHGDTERVVTLAEPYIYGRILVRGATGKVYLIDPGNLTEFQP